MSEYNEEGYNSEEEEEFYDDYSDSPSAKRIKTYPHIPINPVICTTAPALKDIASAAVAISLWKHTNIMGWLSQSSDHCAKESYSWVSLKLKVEKLSSQLPVPQSVARQIDRFIPKVGEEIANWATYHFRCVYLNTTKDYIAYNRVNDLIWNSDATINCKETAKNISKSKSPRLSEVEKYYFLCTYCLKDEMEQMSPTLWEVFQDQVYFDQHPLIYYWNCYFRKKLHSIETNEDVSLDCTMFRSRFVDNWPAKEYFFDRMSPEEQIEYVVWLIDKRGAVYQKVLLMKLNESQRISVYLEKAVQIITNYVRTGANWTDVLATWSDIRDLITREQFLTVFSELLRGRAPGDVLTNVWISLDFDLKDHLLNYKNYAFIENILKSFEWANDFNFVIIVSQDLNADMKTHVKEKFLDAFCEKLFSQREHLQWLDRFSDIYFGEGSKEFKTNFVLSSNSIKNLCFDYYSSGDVKGYNDMLAYLFSQMPDLIPWFKRTVLHSSNGTLKFVELLDSESLDEIIFDTLSEADLVAEFKKKVIFSPATIIKLKKSLVDDDGLNKVKEIIDRFLTLDEHKANLKKKLVDEPTKLIRGIFSKSDESHLESLLLWVFGEETLAKQFKKNISVRDIFDTMLEEAASYRCRYYGILEPDAVPNTLDSLDRFLIWYFGSPSVAKKYKIRRYHSYYDIDLVARLARRRNEADALRLKNLMTWFFENDAAEIAKFNQVNTGKIAKVL